MKSYILALFMLIALTTISAVTLCVALDGSQPYNSIQSAIEAAGNGDTVLVYPGRYIENIDYIGKSITVCSLEAVTSDTTYIHSTIIDGNQSGSCVAFRNSEQNASLRGFTITNGIGNPIFDGLRRGGGILVYIVGQVNITNCIITDNKSACGGGVYSYQSSLSLSGLRVHDNYAIARGGGIALEGMFNHYPSIVFDPINRCSVYSNYGANPVDILVTDIRANLQINLDMFTIVTPDRFYVARHSNIPVYNQYTDTVSIQRAYRTEVNQDLYVSPNGNDINSGLSPSQAMKSITKAIHMIAGDSLNVKTVHVMPGIYSEGDNDQILPIPLKSHVNLIGAGSDITTIFSNQQAYTNLTHFLCGDRCENIHIKGFNLVSEISNGNMAIVLANLAKNVVISDIVVKDWTVHPIGAILIYELESSSIDSLVLKNITTPERAFYLSNYRSGSISNSVFENIHSTYSSPDTPGDDSWAMALLDIRVSNSLSLKNCVFRNFSVQNNQFNLGIGSLSQNYNVNIDISNCLFENIRTNNQIAISFNTNGLGEYMVSNCTFYDNYGSIGAVGIVGKITMRNNIFVNPHSPHEIYMQNAFNYGVIDVLDFDYNLIPGGSSGIYRPDYFNVLNYGVHNLDADPLFASIDPNAVDYLHLSTFSPCIDSGTPDVSELDLSPFDLAGNWRIWNGRIDMGCYESGSEPWVSNDDPVIPIPAEYVVSAYPNPFHALTNLKINLPTGGSRSVKISSASVSVYNIKGQRVKSIMLDHTKAGEQYTSWDGSDSNGNRCGSGIYFLNLMINGKQVSSRKVSLIK